MNRIHKRSVTIGVLAMVCAVLLSGDAPRAQGKPEVALRAAMDKEIIDGDLKAALEMYRKLATGNDRLVAAKALLRMGQCYEKLGEADARKTYEQVVKQFADQKDAVVEAQRHLAVAAARFNGAVGSRLVLTAHDDRQYGGSISRDGRYVAYTQAQEGLFHLDLATSLSRRIVSRAQAGDVIANVRISPDGKQVAYQGSSGLYIVGIDASSPRKLIGDANLNVLLAGWSADGKDLLAFSFSGPRPASGNPRQILVSVADGSSRVATAQGLGNAFSMSPNGRYVAFVNRDGVIVQPTASGEGREVSVFNQPALCCLWAPDSRRLLFGLQRSRDVYDLWSVPLTDGRPDGPADQLQKNVPRDLFGPSDDGSYYYQARSSTRDIYTLDVDPQTGAANSPPKQLTSQYDNGGVAWSPDGETVAYLSRRSPNNVVVIRSTTTGRERTLPMNALPDGGSAVGFAIQWSPDGQAVLLRSWTDGQLYRMSTQTGEVGPFASVKFPDPSAGSYKRVATLGPDGKTLYYNKRDPVTGVWTVHRVDTQSGAEDVVCRIQAESLSGIAVSRDGRQLAFSGMRRTDSGLAAPMVTTVDAAGGEPKEVAKLPAGTSGRIPAWSRDGRHLYVPVVSGGNADIWLVPAAGGETKHVAVGRHDLYSLDMSPDGKQLIFMDENFTNELWAMKVQPQLKKGK